MKGVYPDGLKGAEVVPIFKKSDPNDVTNYKPISLLSNFNKIFEKLEYHRLSHFLEKYNLLSNHQYELRSNSLTNFALCNIQGVPKRCIHSLNRYNLIKLLIFAFK